MRELYPGGLATELYRKKPDILNDVVSPDPTNGLSTFVLKVMVAELANRHIYIGWPTDQNKERPHITLITYAISTVLLIAAGMVAVLALLLYTPDRWSHLYVAIWGFTLQASQSDDE